MEIKITLFITVLLYAAVISQSIFYMLAMAKVMNGLSADAYIESRRLLDLNLRKNLTGLYYTTLASSIALVGFCITNPGGLLFFTAVVALIALIADLLLIVKGNLPLNAIIGTWTRSSYPADWNKYRNRWMTVYNKRQVANVIGFVSLIAGMVFGLA